MDDCGRREKVTCSCDYHSRNKRMAEEAGYSGNQDNSVYEDEEEKRRRRRQY